MNVPREDEIIVRFSMLDNLLVRAKSAEAKLAEIADVVNFVPDDRSDYDPAGVVDEVCRIVGPTP